jgi:hypothetical protein
MNRELLEKPFSPDQIKQRKGLDGDVLDYIEGAAVIQRLNDAFNAEWTFEILDHQIHEKEVVVLGKLTAQGISKCQFGKSKITRNKETKAEISIGDDLKAAATDSLKKCATLLGVGLHLYFEQTAGDDHQSASNGHRQERSPDTQKGTGRGNGEFSNGRLTARQLSAIFSLAKAKGWSNKDVRDFTHEMFGKMPDFLTKKEASSVIQHFQQGAGEGGEDA